MKKILIFTTVCLAFCIPALVAAQQAVNFSGTYQTNQGELIIMQTDKTVEGSYSGRATGNISGTVSGNRLDYIWYQPEGRYGHGYFELFDNGRIVEIRGRWGNGKSETDGGVWTGSKISDSI